MEIRPIRSEADYDAALTEIEPYFINEPAPGTPDADRFDMLAALIGAYEQKHWRIDAPDAVGAIERLLQPKAECEMTLRLAGLSPED